MKNNKKITTKLFIATMLFLSSFTVFAQEIIKFEALSEPFYILTRDDVNAKLNEYDVDELKANGFIALISDDITEIGHSAFYTAPWNGGNYTNIHLLEVSGKNVKLIGVSAFNSCSGLKSIDFPNLIEIRRFGFYCCQSLISVDLPNVEIIDKDAFALNTILDYECNLTTVNIPKAKIIGTYAFRNRYSLTSINGTNMQFIDMAAFRSCTSLVSVDLPKVIDIRTYSFESCHSLRTVIIGTELEEGTNTDYKTDIFNFVPTGWADLTLGEFVTPKPDTTNSIWHYGTVFPNDRVDYYWRSITIKYIGIEEVVQNATIDISPNPATDYFTLDFELKKSCNMEIILCDVLGKEILTIHNGFAESGLFSKTVDIEHLNSGVYFIKVLIDGKYATLEKIVVN